MKTHSPGTEDKISILSMSKQVTFCDWNFKELRHFLLFRLSSKPRLERMKSEGCRKTPFGFLFSKMSPYDKSWRCIDCNYLHSERFWRRPLLSWVVKETCCDARFLSSSAMSRTRKSISVSDKGMKYLAAEIKVSPGNGTTRISWATFATKFSRALPRRT